MGSNLCENLLIKPSTCSLMCDFVWLWSCFLLKENFAFEFLDDSFLLLSPPDKTSAENLKSNKTCKTPFSDTCDSCASIVEKKFL